MSNVVIEFQEDTQTAFCLYVAYHDGDFLCVQHISKGDLLEYRLSLSHVESIKAIPSLSDLLAYAKANQIQQPQADTLCPCPPETSDNTAKASVEVVFDEVDGGIFTNDDPVDCFVCGDNLTGLDHFQGVCNDCHDHAVLHNLV